MKLSDWAVMGTAVVAITFLAFAWQGEAHNRALAEQNARDLQVSITDTIRVLDSLRTQCGHDHTQFENRVLAIDTLATSGDSVPVFRRRTR